MKILVINAGSSSLKYQLLDMDTESVIAKGNCERIGMDGHIKHTTADGRVWETDVDMPTHTDAFQCVVNALVKGDARVLDSMDEISAVGHRIVQGGAIFSESVLVTDEVIKQIEDLSPLAPLHNPAHVQGLRACIATLGPDVPQVVVFDTAFHHTMPEEAYMFALPYAYYEKYKIRRYGFHGTSHYFVSRRCAELMGRPIEELKIVTCHLGNGSSLCAVKYGKCVDTSMGFTPLDGFIMGTRTGAVDPSAVTYLMEKEHLSPDEMSDLMNKQSGYLGISGVSSDDRDVQAAAKEGNPRAKLALSMLRYQVRKLIGAYAAAMDGLDAIVFTAGIGENVTNHREEICNNLSFLGVKIDAELNAEIRGREALISAPDSRVKVFVIPTNEELVIARDTKAIVDKLPPRAC